MQCLSSAKCIHIMIILIRNLKVEISFDDRYSPRPTYSKQLLK